MKQDARVKYTKMAIREAFMMLLKTRSVDQITVTELCKEAGINRATFYSHYSDCYDLLRSIEDEFLEKFRKNGRTENWCEPRDLITTIYNTIEENMELCDTMIFSVKRPTLLTRMIEVAKEYSRGKWREVMPALDEKEQDILFVYLATGLSAIIYNYFKTAEKEELIDFMVDLTRNCLAPYCGT